jgi:hypothetical protein
MVAPHSAGNGAGIGYGVQNKAFVAEVCQTKNGYSVLGI